RRWWRAPPSRTTVCSGNFGFGPGSPSTTARRFWRAIAWSASTASVRATAWASRSWRPPTRRSHQRVPSQAPVPTTTRRAGQHLVLCAIMPERLAQTDRFKQVTEMIGGGPYRYLANEHVPGAHVVYSRNTAYRPRDDGPLEWTAGPKIAHFERIEWT